MPQTRRRSHPAPLALLAALVALIAPAAQAAPPDAPPAVIVAAARQKDVQATSRHVGRVEAMQSVDLRARVQGYLERIAFREGGLVRAGQTLFVIEQDAYRNQVAADRAKAAQAQAALAQAEQYLARLKSAGAGSVSAADMEQAISVQLQAKAAVAQAQANLAQAELNLGYATVKAPIDGRIGRAAYTVGNLVGPESGALARIVQVDPIRVVYSISETELPRRGRENAAQREAGRQVRLLLGQGHDYPIVGKVEFIDNEVDPATGTIAVRAVFANPEGLLTPGQFVTVNESSGPAKPVVLAPQSAVLEDQDGRHVFVVDGQNIASKRPVVTDGQSGPDWVIASGLAAGELIVVQGVQKVRPGQAVKPVADAGR